jgi:hypothetical protein
VTILGVIAVLAVLPPRSPVAPQDANAMYNLGHRYQSADGVAQDYGKAGFHRFGPLRSHPEFGP